MKKQFDYYYGSSGEAFQFFKIPKALFYDVTFRSLSTDSKVLYGIMLDRLGLSRKNNWIDRQNRVYIEYSNDEIMEKLGVSKNTVTKLIKELCDFGLIDRQRRGPYHGAAIYVMDFSSGLKPLNGPPGLQEKAVKKTKKRTVKSIPGSSPEKLRVPKFGNHESQNMGVKSPKVWESRVANIGSQESQKMGVSFPYKSKTEKSDTEWSETKQISPHTPENDVTKFFENLRDCFIKTCPSFEKPRPVLNWSKKRKNLILEKQLTLEEYQKVFERLEASDFLTGRKAGKDGTLFKAPFSWILQPENWERILEGGYDNFTKPPIEEKDKPSYDLEAYERESIDYIQKATENMVQEEDDS